MKSKVVMSWFLMRRSLLFITLSLTSIMFTGCLCLTCWGNGTCANKAKCEGVGHCEYGYAKCTSLMLVDEPYDMTCDGKGSCDRNMTCDGIVTYGDNNIAYCKGHMICGGTEGTCEGNGVCIGGIGVCDGVVANCVGYGTCQGVAATCLGLPGTTYDSDIMLEHSLNGHDLSNIK
ncbi:hypothetical protein [Sulfurimonas sp. CS5]|uniref:hypothetical protein n=1 Tax=Sulfurimonas sp. CS5 TaxID=3391145 RepID=UPI0039E76DC3